MVLKMIVIAYAQSHADWYQCFRSVKGNDKKDGNPAMAVTAFS